MIRLNFKYKSGTPAGKAPMLGAENFQVTN